MFSTTRIIGLAIILASCFPLLRGQSSNNVSPVCPPRPPSENLDADESQVIFDSVEFPAESEVPVDAQQKLADKVKGLRNLVSSDPNADPYWLDDVKELLRLTLQDEGYFKAIVDATPGLIRAEPHLLHYWISVDATLGPKYLLGDATFSGTSIYPDVTLRKTIDLQRGDVFDASKIREGLDRIRRVYAKRGHIDMTAEPEFKIHDEDNRIDLNFKIEEGGQYRIKSVEVRALDKSTENLVLSKLGPGQVFDPTALDELSKAHPELPPIDSLYIWRDAVNHNIGIVIAPKSCRDVAESADTPPSR